MKQTITLTFRNGQQGELTFDVNEDNPLELVQYSEPYEEDETEIVFIGETHH